jgi:hypothetical protein
MANLIDSLGQRCFNAYPNISDSSIVTALITWQIINKFIMP